MSLNRSLLRFRRSLDLCLTQGRRCLATAPKPQLAKDDPGEAKPWSSIPGPRLLPYFGSLYMAFEYMDEAWLEKLMAASFRRYGHIYREQVGPVRFVFTCDVDDVERLHRQEGKYPRRMPIIPWCIWRDEHDLSRGLLTGDGHEWKQMRVVFDKQMLKPQHVVSYADGFNEVITDLLDRFGRIRRSQSNGITVPNVVHELFHWSFESIGVVLYETRFGGLAENRKPETTRFIDAIQDVFTATNKLQYQPKLFLRTFLKNWKKKHDEGWEVIFETTRRLIDQKYDEIQKKLEKKEDVSGFLHFLMDANLGRDEIYGNIAEIMLGAVDTTSNNMQWILYELSRNPDFQEKLHAEVTGVVPAGKIPSHADIQEMPLLKATIKEALRLYPTTVVNTRIVDDDIILSGYRIPRETIVIASIYVMGRDPKLFPDPLAFKPERWLRKDSKAETIHSFSWLPFGFGPRSCIGRRIAELEMHLLLARMSQTYFVSPADNYERKPVVRGLLSPDKQIDLNFEDRK